MSEQEKTKLPEMNARMIRRLFMTVVGIFFTAVSVAIFRKALLGVDPFTCLVAGIENKTGLSFSVVFPGVQVVMLIVTLFFGRKYINIGTLLTLFGVGIVVEKTAPILDLLAPEPSLLVRAIILLFGFTLVCFAGSLYMTADLGVSAYDAMALILHDRLSKIPFRFCRIATEFICVIIGFIFHANIGIATLLTALFMGPLIHFFNHKISIPFMEGRNN